MAAPSILETALATLQTETEHLQTLRDQLQQEGQNTEIATDQILSISNVKAIIAASLEEIRKKEQSLTKRSKALEAREAKCSARDNDEITRLNDEVASLNQKTGELDTVKRRNNKLEQENKQVIYDKSDKDKWVYDAKMYKGEADNLKKDLGKTRAYETLYNKQKDRNFNLGKQIGRMHEVRNQHQNTLEENRKLVKQNGELNYVYDRMEDLDEANLEYAKEQRQQESNQQISEKLTALQTEFQQLKTSIETGSLRRNPPQQNPRERPRSLIEPPERALWGGNLTQATPAVRPAEPLLGASRPHSSGSESGLPDPKRRQTMTFGALPSGEEQSDDTPAPNEKKRLSRRVSQSPSVAPNRPTPAVKVSIRQSIAVDLETAKRVKTIDELLSEIDIYSEDNQDNRLPANQLAPEVKQAMSPYLERYLTEIGYHELYKEVKQHAKCADARWAKSTVPPVDLVQPESCLHCQKNRTLCVLCTTDDKPMILPQPAANRGDSTSDQPRYWLPVE